MPGINLVASKETLSEHVRAQFARVQAAMLHFPSYRYQPILAANQILIGATAPPSYPTRTIHGPDGLILLEGLIYNLTANDVETELQGLLTAAEDPVLFQARLRQFVSRADGDFVLHFYHEATGQLFTANDSLGRLPLYYAVAEGRLLISREPKFIAPFQRSLKFNRLGFLAYLMYGFTYGTDTLLEGVQQLEPKTILHFDCRTGALARHASAFYSTETRHWTDQAGVVSKLKNTFLNSVAWRLRRCADQESVVSLSGGLDSRATLAAILHCGAKVRAVTIQDSETAHTEAVARALEVPLDIITADEIIGGSRSGDWMFLKDGLDSMTAQASFHAFMEKLVARYGAGVAYWTGTYGGELTRFLHLTSGINSLEALGQYLLNAGEEYKYSTHRATRMLGLSMDEARQSLMDYLHELPEVTPVGKYVRFRHEFDRKYTGNGEDRNRFYAWTITPFAGLEYFPFAASLDENRKNTRLFRDFLHALDPRVCGCAYYNLNVNLQNNTQLDALAFVERVARIAGVKKSLLRINKAVKFFRRHAYHPPPLSTQLLTLLREDAVCREYFDVREIEDILKTERDAKGLSRLCNLLTYVSILQRFCRQVS